ncbi:MAG: CotH kinase family protein, partial [Quisquiliibacterium sp.]
WATLTAHLVSDEACTGMFDLYCSGGAVTSVPQGVYVNVEQVDKQFLKNRDVWASDKTWLYKKSEIGGSPELKEAGCQESSPVVEALQCSPFIGPTGKGKHKIEPDACAASLLNDLIDMQAMLGVGAVNAFSSNPDELLNHEKNFFWADYSDSSEPVTCTSPHAQIKRTHYPWDLDSGIYDVERNVYGQATEPRKGRKGTSTTLSETSYQAVFLKDYGSDAVNFRTQYNQQLLALSGESSVEDILAFLDATELLLSELLEADPNSKITNAEEHFDYLRAWVSQRAVNVGTQVCDDDPALCSQ